MVFLVNQKRPFKNYILFNYILNRIIGIQELIFVIPISMVFFFTKTVSQTNSKIE